MKLRQLVYLQEVVQQSFNVSNAANALFTSQSGVSRQLQDLAEELGVELFRRQGKRLIGLTTAGEEIVAVAAEVLRATQRIKKIADTHRDGQRWELMIVATRHALAARLHDAIVRCRQELPALQVQVTQEDPSKAYAMLRAGDADLGFVSEPVKPLTDLAYFPLAEWQLLLVVPQGHPLGTLPQVTLEAIAGYPCCSFERASLSRQVLDQTFESAGLKSPIAFSLTSTASILQYVETGVGLGFVGEVSFMGAYHPNLQPIDVGHLFRSLTSGVVLPRNHPLSDPVRSFVQILAPHLDIELQNGRIANATASA